MSNRGREINQLKQKGDCLYGAYTEQKGFKGWIKRKIAKMVYSSIYPSVAQVHEMTKRYRNGLIEVSDEIDNLSEKLEKLQQELNESREKNAAVVRQLMKVKWAQIDAICKKTETPDDILTCKICGYQAKRQTFEKKISECIYNGGRLERYICPECGAIFGPTKFSNLTQAEKDEDYYIHYLGFSEGDSTEKEIKAFYMLNPDKNGVYLNYGCGSWSKSIQKIRSEGYNVYGYEPYAPESDNPYLITDIEQLKKMRFDGIYSNDVIEHLINPVEDFIFMKSLLKDPRSKMSHSTSCYIYKHEVTRFHTHFFTGRSVEVLCEKAGLKILDCKNEVDTDADFYCYVYGIKENEVSYLKHMYVTDRGMKTENCIVLGPGAIMFGPYLFSGSMKYHWKLFIETDWHDEISCRVTADNGRKVIKELALHDGENDIIYELNEFMEKLEIVVTNNCQKSIKIKSVALI